MTKAELVNEIAKKSGIDKDIVLSVVESLMSSIRTDLANDENVYLRGFGSFIVKRRRKKLARNISQNTSILVPAHYIPAFRPAKIFKEDVSK